MEHAKPLAQHEWLQRLLGNWRYESPAGPEAEAGLCTGVEQVRTMGGIWVLCEGEGQMPDGSRSSMQITLGYDPELQAFVGTFISSCMHRMWHYRGQLEADGQTLTLESEGPSFSDPGKQVLYRDVIAFQDNDRRELRSYCQGDEGQWQLFMSAQYQRQES